VDLRGRRLALRGDQTESTGAALEGTAQTVTRSKLAYKLP